MKEVLVLRDLECIKAIVHPKRIDILKAFNDLPLSAKQLSQMLDEPHAKINYHIKTLYKVGILELVEEKIKSGIVEKYYYPKAKNIVIDKNVINISLRGEDDEVFLSKFDAIIELFYQAAEEQVLEEKNIVYVIEDITLSLKSLAEEKEIDLIFDTNIEDCIMNFDQDAIERCIINIVGNAIKFTNKNGQILVNLIDSDNTLTIAISDTGSGIPLEKIDSIFDRFSQVVSSKREFTKGSGLGLTITKGLIELHGGTITVTSELDKGSTFTIILPKNTSKAQ